MSKLYNQYLKLKNKNNEIVYIFKSGIFYIFLDEDAKKISEMFSFKLINLNENVVKCGFPQNRANFYLNQLTLNHINFEIIDSNYSKTENYSDYLNNNEIRELLNSIIQLDMNLITFKQSFDFLNNLNIKLKEIYNK